MQERTEGSIAAGQRMSSRVSPELDKEGERADEDALGHARACNGTPFVKESEQTVARGVDAEEREGSARHEECDEKYDQVYGISSHGWNKMERKKFVLQLGGVVPLDCGAPARTFAHPACSLPSMPWPEMLVGHCTTKCDSLWQCNGLPPAVGWSLTKCDSLL